MGKGTIKTKAMTMAVAMSMVAGLCPSTVFAASGSVVAKDGTYTATKHVVNNPDDENDWDEYDVEVSLTVSDGKFSNITVTPKNGYDSTTNDSYFNKAYNKSKGINTLLKDKDATEDTINGWDTKTGATCTATAVKAAALEAIQSAPAASTEVGDEANQGLCTGTENYWCVNKDADEADIQATLDFMDWCVTSDEGTKCMADDMGFNIPFKKAQESKNLFIKEDKQMTEDGKTPVAWNFSTMPSEEWKNGVGSALTAYAADQTDANWDAVVSAFVDGWASEYKLANE